MKHKHKGIPRPRGLTAKELISYYSEKNPDTDCWEWSGPRTPNGYGLITFMGENFGTHRFSYHTYIGPLTPGLQLDHFVCDNTMCVNPCHVREVTSRENNLRSNGMASRNTVKTHCPQGHEYNEKNTHVHKGKRKCKECDRRSTYLRRHNRKTKV